MPSPALHLRAPLLWLLLPLMAGLAAARVWSPPAGLWLFVVGASCAAIAAIAAAFLNRPKIWMACLVLSAGLGGYVLLHARYPGLNGWETRPPREITVTLEVWRTFPVAPQARSLNGLATITATGADDRELIGRRVYYSAIRRISVPPQRSGRYLIQGVIEPLARDETPDGFNDYLQNLGIRHQLTRARILLEAQPPGRLPLFFSRTQGRLEELLGHGLERHPAIIPLYRAMLLGDKAVLSGEQQNAFMRSGTFHIFCIAGLHVGVIAAALRAGLLLLRVPRRPAVVLTLLLLWVYVRITGANTPAERAFLMITFWLVAQVFRWPGNGLAALTTAALVTLLLDPLELFSTGFQMSYTVVLTLVVLGAPLAEQWLAAWRPFAYRPKPDWRWYHHAVNRSGRGLLGAMAICWASFLASTPSSIGYFHLFSPGSLVANLVIVPLASLAITAGFLSILGGLAGLHAVCALFNSAAALVILTMDWLVRHAATVPGFYFPARFTSGWMAPAALVALTAVLLAGVAGRWSRRYGGYWPPVIVLGLLIIFGVKFG